MMKTLLKVCAWLIGIVVLLLVVVVVALPLLFDPNDYREEVAKAVEQRTGRSLRIDGEIGLSLFPWLGVELGRIELGNAVGFPGDYFARAEAVQVRVKLISLLKQAPEMDTVVVSGLALNLARNAEGRSNWDDFAAARGDHNASTYSGRGGSLAAVAIGGLDIRDASLTWDDAVEGTHASLEKVTLRTGTLSAGKPVDLDISFGFAAKEPRVSGQVTAKGELSVDPDTLAVRANGLDVKVTALADELTAEEVTLTATGNAMFDQSSQALEVTELVLNVAELKHAGNTVAVEAKGVVTGSLAEQTFNAPGLAANVKLAGDSLAGGEATVNLVGSLTANLASKTLRLSAFELDVSDMATSGLTGKASLRGDADVDLAKQVVNIGGLQLNGDFSGDALPGGALALTLGGELQADLGAQQATLKGLDFDTLGLKGKGDLAVQQWADTPQMTGTVALSPFNPRALLERLALPEIETTDPKALTQAELSTTLSASRADASLENLSLKLDDTRFSGSVAVSDLTRPAFSAKLSADSIDADRYLPPRGKDTPPVTPAGASIEVATLPVETLRSLDIDAAIRVGTLKAGGLTMKEVDFGLKAKDGLISAAPLSAALYGGTYQGNVELDARKDQPALKLDEKVSGVQFGPLLADLLGKAPEPPFDDARGDIALRANATAGLNNQVFTARGLTLATNLKGKGFPGGRLQLTLGGDAALDLKQQTLSMDPLSFDAPGLKATAKVDVAQLLGEPVLSGSLNMPPVDPRYVLGFFGQPPPKTADPNAFRSLALNTTFNASANDFKLDPLDFSLDQTAGKGRLEVAKLSGPVPALKFDLQVDTINVDRYLAPAGTSSAADPVSGANAATPLAALLAFDVDGNVTIKQLIVSNLELTDVRVTAKGKDGQLQVHPIGAVLYGGTYAGNLQVEARGDRPKVSFNESLTQVEVGRVVGALTNKNFLTGRGDLNIVGTATGNSADELKRSLNGQVAMDLRDGYISGVDIVHLVCSVFSRGSAGSGNLEGILGSVLSQATAGQGQQSQGRTKFAELNGSFAVANGIARNNDMSMKSPLLRVRGAGDIDIAKERMDYLAEASLVGSCEGQGGLEREDLSRITIPVRIYGPLAQLKYEPQLSSLLVEQLQRRTSPTQPQQPAQQQQQQVQQPQTQPKPEDVLQDPNKAIEGLLKGLLN